MASFDGLLVLVGEDSDPFDATIDVGHGRMAVRANGGLIGDWRLDQVGVRPVEEVVCLSIDGGELAFLPITPGFREAVGERSEIQRAPRARPVVGVTPSHSRRRAALEADAEHDEQPAPRAGKAVIAAVAALLVAATGFTLFRSGADATPADRSAPTLEAEGAGNAMVTMAVAPQQVTILGIEHDGRGPFTISALSTTGAYIAEVVSGAGPYEGRRLLGVTGSDAVALQVRADGTWRVAVEPLGGAQTLSRTVSGTGDDVLIVTGTNTGLGIGHEGLGTFTVEAYGPYGRTVLVSQVGVYTGTTAFPRGTIVLAVESDGEWVLSPR